MNPTETPQAAPESPAPDPVSDDTAMNLHIFEALHAYLVKSRFWRNVEQSRTRVLDPDTSLRHHPRTLDLSPNPALPPLERALQASLLPLIVEFGGIARDLDYLGSGKDGDFLSRYGSLWSDAQSAAFTQAIEHSGGRWL